MHPSHPFLYTLFPSYTPLLCQFTLSPTSSPLSLLSQANLMTFNKIENGIMTLHKQDINVKQYINNVADSFAAEAREKGIYFLYM